MQNVRLTGSGRFPPRFQRKAWEARQEALERVVHEVVRVKPRLQQRLWDVGNVRNTEHLQRKVTGNVWSQPERGHVGCNWQ
jgi:hypothetical protein